MNIFHVYSFFKGSSVTGWSSRYARRATSMTFSLSFFGTL